MKVRLKNSKVYLPDASDFENVSCHLTDHKGPAGWIHPAHPELLFFALSHPYMGENGVVVTDRDFKFVAGFRGNKLKDIRACEVDLSELERISGF